MSCVDNFSPPFEECRRRLEDISASDELGLSEGSGEITFAVIREALSAGRVQFDPDIFCDCLFRINSPISSAECRAIARVAFGEGFVEEIIPEQCGNDQYPGTLLPDGFNPVAGRIEN